MLQPQLQPASRAPRLARRGFTLIEMMVVLVILLFLVGYFGKRFIAMGPTARIKATQQLINRIGIALALYQAECHDLPPDTGYGMAADKSSIAAKKISSTVVYDPGSLWRYLAQPVKQCRADGTLIQMRGPYLSFKYDPNGFTELQAYTDPVYGESYYVVDAWNNPLGYVGNSNRIIHNRDFCDLFSAGPDGKTGQDFLTNAGSNNAYNSLDQNDVSYMGAAVYNGTLTEARGIKTDDPADLVLDDINNWDPQQ